MNLLRYLEILILKRIIDILGLEVVFQHLIVGIIMVKY